MANVNIGKVGRWMIRQTLGTQAGGDLVAAIERVDQAALVPLVRLFRAIAEKDVAGIVAGISELPGVNLSALRLAIAQLDASLRIATGGKRN